MRRAAVYRRGGKFFIHSCSKTTAGVWVLSEPISVVSPEDGVRELGRMVLLALDASRENVPHPTDWKGILSPVLALSGVRSWAAFAKNASYVEIEGEEGNLTLTPAENLGAREGFREEPSKRVSVMSDDVGILGAEIAELLAEGA